MKSPFKFLDPYELKDYKAFFGRKTETKELYNLVTKNRITFVYGPSGTGKTSLVQCGLAHRFGGTDWLPLFVRRGEDINASLRQEIGKVLGKVSYEGEIKMGIQTLYRRFYRPVYLIFDQFEELFILSDPDSKKERLPFYETIADILDAELPCRLLFIMREDYFGHLNEFEQVVPELYHRKIRVEPMNRENLLEVIKGSCAVHHIGFGEAQKDPDRILDKMQADKAGTHMPHVQVYLHMLWQEAQNQQGENEQQGIIFNQAVIESVGEIKDVLGRFLSEQKVTIQKQLVKDGFQPPEEVAATVLDVFVSDDGTKIPIPYSKIANKQNKLTGKFANRLARLDTSLIAACLNELEYARILRRSEEDYEIAHDTLAAIVDQQRSADQRQLREIERRIELGYREHHESKQSEQLYYFDAGQMARIEPFLEKAALRPEWSVFLEDSNKEIIRKELEEIEKQKAALEVAQQRAKKEEGLRAEAEKAQKIAEANAKRAKLRTRLAALLSIIALLAAGTAFWQFKALKTANEKTVEVLLKEVDNKILQLDYRAAFEQSKAAFSLNAKLPECKKRFQEIAFFYTESEKWGKADTCLKVLNKATKNTNRTSYLEEIEAINPIFYSFLQKRYYPEMVLVEGGAFKMGNLEGSRDEQLVLNVQLDNFYLAKTETTNWQYFLFAEATSHEMKPPSWQIMGDNPVVFVDWYDATEYMNWLSDKMNKNRAYLIDKTQKDTSNQSSIDNKRWLVEWQIEKEGYRLPTEAEWEYAAKGGKHRQTFEFAGSDELKNVGWYYRNSNNRTQAIAQLTPNSLDIYDMSGNVREWCWDWYDAYETEKQSNPRGAKKGSSRVLRGGSWFNLAEYCRVSNRDGYGPAYRDDSAGFRIALSQ